MRTAGKISVVTLLAALSMSTAIVATADPNSRKFDENRYFNEKTYLNDKPFDHPEDYMFIYNKGIRLFNEGKLGLAEIHFRRALKGSRCHYQASAYLGIINIKQNDHKSAVRYLRKAVKGNPSLYSLKATLGLSYIEIGKVEKAVDILDELTDTRDKFVNDGADETDVLQSISVLEQALLKT